MIPGFPFTFTPFIFFLWIFAKAVNTYPKIKGTQNIKPLMNSGVLFVPLDKSLATGINKKLADPIVRNNVHKKNKTFSFFML